jgi:hypothetical protein
MRQITLFTWFILLNFWGTINAQIAVAPKPSPQLISSSEASIIGKWYGYDGEGHYLVFDSLKRFNVYDADGEPLLHGGFRYTIDSQTRTLPWRIKVENLTELDLYVYDKYIVVVSYKGRELSHHIDEVGLFVKNKKDVQALDFSLEPKHEVLVPENYRGAFFIAFSQHINEELAQEKDRTILRVNQKGLLLTSAPDDPVVFARKNEEFRHETSGKTLPVFYRGFSLTKVHEQGPKPGDVCVLSLGFNQNPRHLINEKFGQKIEGNVGQYMVDTFENLLKYDKDK